MSTRAKPRSWSRREPFRADAQREAAAQTARVALTPRKRVAAKLGRSQDAVDIECSGHPSSRIYRHDELILAAGDPYRLAAHAHATAQQAMLHGKSTDELVARFWELMAVEAQREGAENVESQGFAHGGDLLALAFAHEAEASVSLELAAIARELDLRGVDPRQWKQS